MVYLICKGDVCMSGYNIESFLRDFSNRTMKNLNTIDRLSRRKPIDYHEIYEVTQLINSLLGLVIIPYEASKKAMESKLKELSYSDYEKIEKLIQRCDSEKRLYTDYENDKKYPVGSFVRHIRNSVAHGGNRGLHFFPIEEGGQISDVFFYDNNKSIKKLGKDINEFCVKLKIEEIREVVHAVSELYCKFDQHEKDVSKKHRTHKEDIGKLNSLLVDGRGTNLAETIFNLEREDI